jgi:hypothetical protein
MSAVQRNLTFVDTAEQPGDCDSGHSRAAIIARQEIAAERLHPKIAYSRCRPKGEVHARIPDTTQQTFESIARLTTYPTGHDDPAPVSLAVPWHSIK